MIQLVQPSSKYKDSFIAAIKEFQSEGRSVNVHIHALESRFPEFITQLENRQKGIGLQKGYVPASMYWLIDNNEFVGQVDIRHELTKKLLTEGGHIGYEIRPSKRKRGYGTRILKLALPIAKELGIAKVLVTCDDDNIGSWKIIEKNGGMLENKIKYKGKIKRRYWIEVT